MKSTYPTYPHGTTEALYNSLEPKEKEILDSYLVLCRATVSKDREEKVKIFLLQARDIIGKPLHKFTREDVIGFLAVLNRSSRKDWTRNDIKKIFKKFLKWQFNDLEMVEGEGVKQAFKTVSMKKAVNKQKLNPHTMVTPEELEKLIRGANHSLKWTAIVALLYEGALRPCELRALKWGDLHFHNEDDPENRYLEISVNSPKTGEHRDVFVKDCIIHIQRWREEFQFPGRNDNDFVFTSQFHRDKPLGEGVISEMFQRLCTRAGLRRINPYLLRHSRLTHMKDAGVSLETRSAYAGHSPEIDAVIYTHTSKAGIKKSIFAEVYPTEELTPEKKSKLDQLEEENRKLKEKLESYEAKFMKKMNEAIDEKFMGFVNMLKK